MHTATHRIGHAQRQPRGMRLVQLGCGVWNHDMVGDKALGRHDKAPVRETQ